MSREDEVRKIEAMNSGSTSKPAVKANPTMIVGVVIVFLGIAFLGMILGRAGQADLIPRQAVPILIFLGGVMLAGAGRAAAGLALMAFSLIFLLRTYNIVPAGTFDQLWFGLLILVGLVLIVSGRTNKQ